VDFAAVEKWESAARGVASRTTGAARDADKAI
jgi:hypothetical protein